MGDFILYYGQVHKNGYIEKKALEINVWPGSTPEQQARKLVDYFNEQDKDNLFLFLRVEANTIQGEINSYLRH